MARSTWRGAIELAGFPVNVALYNRVKSVKNTSFTTLGPDKQPIHQVLVAHGEYEKLQEDPTAKVETLGREDTRKGVPVGDGFKELDAKSLEAIAEREKSGVVAPRKFVPLDTIDLALADRSFTVVPDDKVPGSEKSVEVLAAGLLDTGLAYTTELTTRAGSRDAILIVYVEDDELRGASLPFEAQLQDVPVFTVAENAKAAALFATFVEDLTGSEFVHSEYPSEAEEVRQAAIDAALKGETIKAPAKKAKTGSDDLLAALEGAVAAAPASKKRKAPAKKASSKSKARA